LCIYDTSKCAQNQQGERFHSDSLKSFQPRCVIFHTFASANARGHRFTPGSGSVIPSCLGFVDNFSGIAKPSAHALAPSAQAARPRGRTRSAKRK
jgi:hypothetical protein